MLRIVPAFAALMLVCTQAAAWWQSDWGYRKQITLDTTPAGADIPEALINMPVLVRLHTGNFSYFLDMQPEGGDIRFVAGDDITPLKYHIEAFDPVNELAMVWVQMPTFTGNANTDSIWMYYGSGNAVSGEDAAGSFDVNATAVLHFSGAANAQKDVSAYGNHPVEFTATALSGALIGAGVRFDGDQIIRLPDSPTLRALPEKGWTFSSWLKIDADQSDAIVMQRGTEQSGMTLAIEGDKAYLRLRTNDGQIVETARNTQVTPGAWHNLAVVIAENRASLFLDGVETAYVETPVAEMGGAIAIGSSAVEGQAGFAGELDEVAIANIARSPEWLRAMVRIQGPQSRLLVYGEDGQQEAEGGGSYFGVILQNVTLDGWVVIVMLAVMAAISWVVMVGKAMVIRRVEADNRRFLSHFQRLSGGHEGDLDRDESEDDDEERESSLLLALSGKHDHYQSSTLYRIYHVGVQEMHHRDPKAVGAAGNTMLSPQAIDVIKAAMDGTQVRENQRLNSQMVLLTIAISGGPFLGLLGTVVGVMITFAAIAASGDVNVNAIAPGIAAALVATVAGLAVAIPALFGYNWLGSKIKEISADMQVFVDEFITKIAEQHAESGT